MGFALLGSTSGSPPITAWPIAAWCRPEGRTSSSACAKEQCPVSYRRAAVGSTRTSYVFSARRISALRGFPSGARRPGRYVRHRAAAHPVRTEWIPGEASRPAGPRWQARAEVEHSRRGDRCSADEFHGAGQVLRPQQPRDGLVPPELLDPWPRLAAGLVPQNSSEDCWPQLCQQRRRTPTGPSGSPCRGRRA
jgi:hypothetical protein